MGNTRAERQSKSLYNLEGGRSRRAVLSYMWPVFSLIPGAAWLLPAQPLPIMWLKPHLFQQPESKSASHPLTHNSIFDVGTLTPCCSSSGHYYSQLSTQMKMRCPQRARCFSLTTPAQSSRFSSKSPSVPISAEILGFALQRLRCRLSCGFCRMRGEAGNSGLVNSKIFCSSYAKLLETVRSRVTSERICQCSYSSYRKMLY